jgi:pimeloyl-ACP methyl ester carboxylesterase
MSEIDIKRRRLLGTTALGIAAANLPFMRSAYANGLSPSALTQLTPLKNINAGVLNVGYYEAGPADGPPVFLLHGYPYDIHSYIDVAAILAAKGCRVIVPHLRGHGTTRFLDSATLRTGQQSAVAMDIIALMDALKIDRAVMAGYDWGARTACIIAALWPQRCIGLLSVNGYLIQNIARNALPLPAKAEVGWWYQYYFATERGRAGLAANRRDIARIIWKTNSPTWHFDDATFDRAAASFDNPDYVDIVIHNYRWRLDLAAGDPQYDALEKRLAAQPAIGVTTITMDGDADGVVPATDGTSYAAKFSGRRSHRIIKGAGHNLPQEAPTEFSDVVMTLLATAR